MKTTFINLAMAAGMALAAPFATAGPAGSWPPAPGDIVLGFQATGGTGSATNLFYNLGPGYGFRDTPSQGTLANLAAQLTDTFGADWFDRDDLYFGLIANRSPFPTSGIGSAPAENGDPSRTFYVSRAGATNAPGAALLFPLLNSSQLGTAGQTLAGQYTMLGELTATGGVATLQSSDSTRWANGWTTWNPFLMGGQSIAYKQFGGGIQNSSGKGGPVYVDLQRMPDAGPVTFITTIAITEMGDVVAATTFRTLNLTAPSNGTITGATNGAVFADGAVVDLTATPDPGYLLDGWLVDDVPAGAANPLQVTMNANKTVAALFEEDPSATVTLEPVTNGAIDGLAVGGVYTKGETATLTAVPAFGFALQTWTGDVPGNQLTENPLSLLVDANKTVGATFVPDNTDSNGNGFTDFEEAQLDGILKQFAVGDVVDIGLDVINTTGTERLIVTGLPLGLSFNSTTKRITGTIRGLLGERLVVLQVRQGTRTVRSIPFAMLVRPYQFLGSYAGLLETTDAVPLPAGMIRVLVTSPGVYSATLSLAGQGNRTARGTFVGNQVDDTRTLNIAFRAGRSNNPPATVVQMTISSYTSSDLVEGNRDGNVNTLRGVRLSKPGRTPEATRRLTVELKYNADPAPDGVTVPAGTGTLSGTANSAGVVLLRGFTGDGMPLTASLHLSQTNQCVFWAQPYRNKTGYIGGILTIGDLGLPSRGASISLPLDDGLKWLKADDARERAYPLGFPVQNLTGETSRWITPPSATAMSDSLGLDFSLINAGYRDPLNVANLPTQFRLTNRFALLRTAPATSVPWVGSAARLTGAFTGTPTFPAPIGRGSVAGVFLQDQSFGAVVGTGLVRVPLPAAPVRGSYQTISIDLAQ